MQFEKLYFISFGIFHFINVKSILNGWSACSSSRMSMKIYLEMKHFTSFTFLFYWFLEEKKCRLHVLPMLFILMWKVTSVLIIKGYFQMSLLALYFSFISLLRTLQTSKCSVGEGNRIPSLGRMEVETFISIGRWKHCTQRC